MDERRDDRAPRKAGGGRRTDYGVIITNLPRGCSWQDLKDHMRKCGDVVFTDVDKYGEGVVEFSNRDDMEYAIRTLNDTEFKNFNESSFIRVKAANKDGRDSGRGQDRRSASRSHSVSRSRSPVNRKSASRSRSRSPCVDRTTPVVTLEPETLSDAAVTN
jgi:arginine/serine-rich splicing factor 1/9